MQTWHGKTFIRLDLLWINLRTFFYSHKTLFEILFLSLYTLEQLTLFILILTRDKHAHIIAGIFALIVIATITFEKICMESRYSHLKELNSRMEDKINKLKNNNNGIQEENIRLKKIVEKKQAINLNTKEA